MNKQVCQLKKKQVFPLEFVAVKHSCFKHKFNLIFYRITNGEAIIIGFCPVWAELYYSKNESTDIIYINC